MANGLLFREDAQALGFKSQTLRIAISRASLPERWPQRRPSLVTPDLQARALAEETGQLVGQAALLALRQGAGAHRGTKAPGRFGPASTGADLCPFCVPVSADVPQPLPHSGDRVSQSSALVGKRRRQRR